MADYGMSGMPSPVPPVSGLPSSGGGIDNLLSQMQTERGAIQANSDKTQEMMKKPIARLDEISEEDKGLKPPELAKLPEAPPPVHSDPLQTFGSPASWLAVFGGLLTRSHLTNSLNAAAGVMNARNQGDAAQTKFNMDLWKANTENAVKMHEFEMDQYKEAIQKLQAGRQDALGEIQAISAATKNDTLYMLASNRDAEGVLKYTEAMQAQANKMQGSLDKQNLVEEGVDLYKQSHPNATPQELHDERVKQTRDIMSAEKGGAQLGGKKELEDIIANSSSTPEQIADAKKRLEDIGTSEKAGSIRGAQAMLISEYKKEHPNATADDLEKYLIKYAGDTSGARKIAGQAVTMDLANGLLNNSLPLLMDRFQAVDNSQFTDWNSFDNYAKQHTNDPDLARLREALLNTESDLALLTRRGGAPTVDSANRAHAVINDLLSSKSAEGVKDQIMLESKAAQAATHEVRDEAEGGAKSVQSSPKLPPEVTSKLKKGVVTTFGNGQQWTVDEQGNPKQVK